MTSAPKDFEILIICLFSVETIVLVTYLDCRADSTVYFIKGFPFNNLRFFRGIPLEPPLAGIIAKIFIGFCISLTLKSVTMNEFNS